MDAFGVGGTSGSRNGLAPLFGVGASGTRNGVDPDEAAARAELVTAAVGVPAASSSASLLRSA